MLKDYPEKLLEKNDSTRDLVFKNNGLKELFLSVRMKSYYIFRKYFYTYIDIFSDWYFYVILYC